MGRVSERRALFYEDDPDYDPFIGVDINEYLIANHPGMTLKQRRSVWRLCQADEDLDWTPIHDEIDAWVRYVLDDAKED